MHTIFDALKDSHEKQRLLLEIILKTSPGSKTRAEFYLLLKEELENHSSAEERYFYAPLIENDQTIELTRHGIAEHHTIDKIIEELDATDLNSPAWLTLAKKLQHKVLHHLEEEERSFFQMAGKALTDNQKVKLAEQYDQEMAL
ncbi:MULTISPECIES: hemerythrin domain-containing protein [Thalassotalea]|uniref:Hemerythrin domain-containing protein n=1 Tax=Thalassotalea castellviae TaxID=3075612 RepID=A0ABU3A5C4_9GAMM|nr:hemerythrin domain-containing protein [Thalassotalea sp. W431]MDT0605100.1 hemerythrin domain-containing protein [Thalassotalea sp. W431]